MNIPSIPNGQISLFGKFVKDGSIAVVGVYLTWQLGSQVPIILQTLQSIQESQMNSHEKISLGVDVSNHFLWAGCVNDAEQIPSPSERKLAISRCIPPPEKVKDDHYKTYPKTSLEEEEGGFIEKVNARAAEKIAEKQDAVHREAIKDAVTPSKAF